MFERSGGSNQSVIYDQKMLTLQQGQLISSLQGTLPQLTTNAMHIDPQNLQMGQGETITVPIMIKNIRIIGSSSVFFRP